MNKVHEINLTKDSKVQRDPDQNFTQIDDEVVMLSYNQGEYFALNDTASRIWTIIESPIVISKIVSQLVSEYSVSESDCYEDTFSCLLDFYKKDLIDIFENE